MVIFSLITLPVERNASDRALKSLENTGLAIQEEREGVRQVLGAATFTYLAGLAGLLALQGVSLFRAGHRSSGIFLLHAALGMLWSLFAGSSQNQSLPGKTD